MSTIILFSQGVKADITSVVKLNGLAITDAARAAISAPAAGRVTAAQSPVVRDTAPGPSQSDVFERLRKLGELRDAGILTEEELLRRSNRSWKAVSSEFLEPLRFSTTT